MYSLCDRIVFVTGASSGIGASCARAFAAQGAQVLMTARRLDRIEALAAALKKEHGVSAHAFQLDVRDQPAVEKAIAGLPPEWQAIEVLVNNAGLSYRHHAQTAQGLRAQPRLTVVLCSASSLITFDTLDPRTAPAGMRMRSEATRCP